VFMAMAREARSVRGDRYLGEGGVPAVSIRPPAARPM